MRVVDTDAHALWEAALRRHLQDFYGRQLGIRSPALERAIEERLALKRGRSLAGLLDDTVGLEGKRVLDVGSGWGELMVTCLERGATVNGVEPDPDEVAISRLLLGSLGHDDTVHQGTGEALPFPDATFDLVTCQQVLEHVQDIPQVVREMLRVTRPGGHLCVSVPNYLFPYEGHYRMKWFPLTPKPIGRLLLKAKRRDPTFLLEHVNYTTYPGMMRLWRRHGLGIRNITLEKTRDHQHRSRVYGPPFGRVLIALRLFPNITWLLEKPAQRRGTVAPLSRCS